MNSVLIRPDKKSPMLLVAIALVFVYVFQYPLSMLAKGPAVVSRHAWDDLTLAYCFVIVSTSVFLPALYIGMSGRLATSRALVEPIFKAKKISLFATILVFVIFFVWSYIMVSLKIGITIYSDFEPLPFKLTGLLFYGRMLVQPLILGYIAYCFSCSKWKPLIFFLLLALGAWATLSSGSRFLGIMFALPLILLFKGKIRYVLFGISVMGYITIASLSRSFYLPYQIDEIFIIQTYANDQYQTGVLENLYLLPINYLIIRSMGIGEVVMTLNFGDITPGIFQSLQNLFAYFFPFIPKAVSVSVKNIYGLDDEALGGFGLDLFSNYWVFFGGSFLFYVPGLVFSAWLMGRTYRLFAIGLQRLGFKEGAMMVFVLLFLLFFEGRAFLFPLLLIVAWLLSRKGTSRRISKIMALLRFKNFLMRRGAYRKI